MNRYYAVGVVLMIWSHSKNAVGTFNQDTKIVEDHLREEQESCVGEPIGTVHSSEERTDILCEELNKDEKQSICDKIMRTLADRYIGDEFFSFLYTPPVLSLPQIVKSWDPYTCEERSIKELNMKKPMFWCGSKLFRMKSVLGLDEIEGFFCAGSRITAGRVFAFRQPTRDSEEVSPLGELDSVDEILQHVPGNRRST